MLLQLAIRVIRKVLLFAQCIAQPFHRLLVLTALPALAFGDLHVLHHLLQLFHQLLGFGHPPLLHQLLDTIHHLLQLILRHLLRFAIFRLLTIRILALFLGQLAHVFARRLAQLVHQFFDFLLRRTVLHRLRQPLLCAFQPFPCIRQIAVFNQQRRFPQQLRHFITNFIA